MGLIILVLLVIIGVMAWFMYAPTVEAPTVHAPAPTSSEPTAHPATALPPPLHTKVEVTSPVSGASVEKTFDVKGEAPGNWFFEASFPIQVRDKDDNVIGRGHGSAQGDWMTESQVAFATTLHIDGNYSGPATLILLRDNPSGLPEKDDSLEIPIVIK